MTTLEVKHDDTVGIELVADGKVRAHIWATSCEGFLNIDVVPKASNLDLTKTIVFRHYDPKGVAIDTDSSVIGAGRADVNLLEPVGDEEYTATTAVDIRWGAEAASEKDRLLHAKGTR